MHNGRLYVLAAGHSLNDFIAGYLLGLLITQPISSFQAAACFLVYNVLAFGGQYAAALLVKSRFTFKQCFIITWSLNLAGLIIFPYSVQLTFVLIGCASALYHVSGGTWAAAQQKAAPIGLFAAPGIVGLAGAGYLSWKGIDVWAVLFILTFVYLALSIRTNWTIKGARTTPEVAHEPIDRHDLFMILLLTAITLRSAIWNIFQMIHEGEYLGLIFLAALAFIGKIVGGVVSDRIGWRLYNLISLSIATPLVTFFKDELILFCIGVALLQSGIPASTALLIQYMKKEKEKAVALSFGTAIVVGGGLSFILQLYVPFARWWLFVALMIITAIIWGYRRRRANACQRPQR